MVYGNCDMIDVMENVVIYLVKGIKMLNVEDNKNKYYSHVRWEIIKLVDGKDNNVLDVGCGDGSTLLKLKETGKAKFVFGMEINGTLRDKLCKELDGCIIGNIEMVKPEFEEKFFNYIIFADILEHLVDPEKILNVYMRYLKDDGYIIASIPNIKYFKLLIRLILLDEFKYADEGILDRTHLRFFTKKEIKRMINGEKLRIVLIRPNMPEPLNTLDKLLYNMIGKLPLSSFFTVQYLLKIQKCEGE